MPTDLSAADFTDEQADAFDALLQPLLEGISVMRKLEGYAGTGKTYLAGCICDALIEEGVEVALCAPTHLATDGLRQTIGSTRDVTIKTVHALLGLVLTGDDTGDYELVPENEPSIPTGGVVICDEGSLVGQKLWDHILAEGSAANWLFVGDPAQLPPVEEEPSPIFDLEGPTLTEIVRQAKGNPIIELSARIRQGDSFFQDELIRFDHHREEGVAITSNEHAFLDSATRLFQSKQFERDIRAGRVLAYRNAVVDRYNRVIREQVLGAHADEFEAGEWLVADATWFRDTRPVVFNSQPMKVEAAQKTTDELGLKGPWTVWEIDVAPVGARSTTVLVLADEDHERYQHELDRLKEQAMEAAEARDYDRRRSSWNNYYRLKEQYAEVSYAFATTIHKAQGSTFESVFLDWRDVRRSSERDRMALTYVGVTRPSKRLGILV